MANMNETCTGLVVVMGATTLAFTAWHTYKFDGAKCLVPKKKEWFRVLLTWMLVGCNLGLLTWGAGWAWVKFDLGWGMYPEPYGALPVQPEQFPTKYLRLKVPLTTAMNIGYSLQMSLNAEEGLYWFHLMRAVKQPSSARSWLNSNFFYAWIVISVLCTAVQCSVGWIGTHGDPNLEIAQELLCSGALELAVLFAASIVLVRFPAFLRDVKASGAGPDVRSRLHFYHEANKVRTFFRGIFAVTLLILGADGMSPNPIINNTPIASDLLIQIALGSFFLVLMISMMLYLPRTYSSYPRTHNVMVAPGPLRTPEAMHMASGHALMSLLREGGQWDDDDDLRLTRPGAPFGSPSPRGGDVDMLDPPKTWSLGSKPSLDADKWDEARPDLPAALQHFTSPIAVSEVHPVGPLQIRIEREVHRDV